MKSRQLTLNTIGLSIRTELRIKSMLEIIHGKTIDRWSYNDGDTADMSICEPGSALTALALKRAALAGNPRCVLLVKDDSRPLPDALTIRDPIRSADFISLLNSVSATTTVTAQSRSGRRAAVASAANSADPFRCADMVRELIKNGSHDVFQLKSGQHLLCIVPATRAVLLVAPLGPVEILDLVHPHAAFSVIQLPKAVAQEMVDGGAQLRRADWLLWCLGVQGPQDHFVPSLPPEARFKLRRWPDFGRIEHPPLHLRLAARLSRRAQDLTELAAAVGEPLEMVRPFVNACALCDLLQMSGAENTQRTAVLAPRVVKRAKEHGYTGLFKTIRLALRFGAT